MKRSVLSILAAATLLAVGCGDDPLPASGVLYWTVSCPPDMGGANCTSSVHQIRASAGSPTAIMDCSITRNGSGYSVFFRAGSIDVSGGTFDEAREGMLVDGVAPALGQEMSGRITLRGQGWTNPAGNLGGTNPCHVFIDAVSGQNFRGRVKCDLLQDDASPPRRRNVRGQSPNTMNNDYGEFSFENCGGAPE